MAEYLISNLLGLLACLLVMHAIVTYASRHFIARVALMGVVCKYMLVINIICYADRLVTQDGGWIEIWTAFWNILLYCARKILVWMLYRIATCIEFVQNWTDGCQETLIQNLASLYASISTSSSSSSYWTPMLVNVCLILNGIALHYATKKMEGQNIKWVYIVASIKYLSLMICVCRVDRLMVSYGDWLFLMKFGSTKILNSGCRCVKNAITAMSNAQHDWTQMLLNSTYFCSQLLQQHPTVGLSIMATLLVSVVMLLVCLMKLVLIKKDNLSASTATINNASSPTLREHASESPTLREHDPDPPPEFVCPITGSIMSYPVLTENGSVYEQYAIQEWFNTHSTDPLTNVYVNRTILIPHRNLLNSIEDWVKKNPNTARAHGYISPRAVPPPLPTLTNHNHVIH